MQRRASAGDRRGSARSISLSRRAWGCHALGLLSFIALSATVGLGADLIVFGPQTYTRVTGQPVTVANTFQVANPSSTYTLRVTNHGVTSAVISINGQSLVGPDDFAGSNTANATLERTVTLVTGVNSIDVQVRSQPGTSLVVEILTTNVDLTPPTIAATANPPPNANAWNNTSVTVSFTCGDGDSGIATCPAPVTVSTEGANQVVSGTAVDKAGNTATASVTLNIDNTPPVVTTSQSPNPNTNGWNDTLVVVSFAATDVLSGVAPGSVTNPVPLSADGANQFATGEAADLAGNVGTATRSGINIDQTPPVVAITSPVDGATVFSPSIQVAGTVADAMSGLDTVTCNGVATVALQSALNCNVSLVLKINTIVAEATDLAGNRGTATISVTYIGAPVITSVSPTSAEQGETISVTLTGGSFAAGITQTSFGAGVSVGGAVEGAFGPITVSNDTTAVAQLKVNSTAALGTRTVAVQNGPQQASLSDGFAIISSGPSIVDFTPHSAPVGTLIDLVGRNLAPNPRITLSRLSGGTIEAPVAGSTDTSIAFVIPDGAATGPIAVAVGADSTSSASPLTITASSDFVVNVQPGTANLIAGQSVSLAVSLSSPNAFAQLATLDVSGVPTGATASFSPPRITAGQTSVLTFTAPLGQPAGSANLTITASAIVDGLPLSHSDVAQLNIETPTTSFLGRTVVADSLQVPLAGVTVTLLGKNGNGGTTGCSDSTVSDAAGNFALTGLGAGCVGPQLVGYDGTTATSPEGKYAGVNIVYTLTADQATPSPVLVNLPRIDDKETFPVRQNALEDQSYSYKTIPGLSVTVYRGTTFTLQDGSRPNPFPLVAVQVPVDRLPDQKPPVPTMLSAFIVAFQPANAVASRPAAVFYPNTLNTDPGVNMTLMTLDPTLGRMVPYGTATVAVNGRQIVPDLNPAIPGTRYGIVNFDWHGPMPPPAPTPPNRPPVNPPPTGGPFGGGCPEPPPPTVGQPCDITSGLETVKETDLSISGPRGRIAVERNYRTLSDNPGPFGIGTNHNYSYFLSQNTPQNALLVHLILPEGNWLAFSRSSTADPLVNDTIPSLQGVRMNTFPDGHSELRWKDGTIYGFAAATAIVPALESITDANRNQITLTRNPAQPIQIAQITDPVGRSLVLTYDGANRVTTIADPIGRRVQYTYNALGTLETVTDSEGGVTRYEYDSENRLVKHTNARGIVIAQNAYESHGRIAQQIQADGGVYKFAYTFVNPTIASAPVLSNAVTDQMGKVALYRFAPDALLTDVRDKAGQTHVFLRDPERANAVIAYKGTAPCESCTGGSLVSPGDISYEYDDRGNVLKETDALGHTTTYTYESTFNRVTSVQDALGHKTTFDYDNRGNLSTRTDASGRTTSYTYNSFGQLTETTDPLKRKTRFNYDSFGNLSTVTDALGNATRFRYDGVSRLVEMTDSLGNRTRTDYDRLDRVVKQTDAKGQTTVFTYDKAGNLAALTDARGKSTTFTYDAMNRLKTRVDPVGETDTRSYDLNGNLVSFTDRRGQMSTFVYDGLNRLIEERYADGSVVTASYDANGRLVQVADSGAGSFTFKYNLTGALVTSNGPTGSVKYVRDGLDRVKQRQVVGQSPVDYAYDPVGNVTGASMPQASAMFAYDALDRPLSLTRSNGVKTDYGYDPVGRLLSIVHSRGTSNLLSLAYSYDATGRRVSQQSSTAQPLVTDAATATVDDANRLVQRGTTSFSYDENGNVTSETAPTGTIIYTWDARNRLSRVATPNGQTTEFTYDFAGNLIRRSDAGPLANVSRSYTLDVLTNVAYEQSSDGDEFSVLTAASIDTHLATRRPNGEVEYGLADGINSTVATVDQSGTAKGRFDYEPFGQTTVTGSAFPFQYSGRVLVLGGLYNYRARFYSSTAARFIGEDPIGFDGGLNLYGYVGNSPIASNDPLGLSGPCVNRDRYGNCILSGDPDIFRPGPTPIDIEPQPRWPPAGGTTPLGPPRPPQIPFPGSNRDDLRRLRDDLKRRYPPPPPNRPQPQPRPDEMCPFGLRG